MIWNCFVLLCCVAVSLGSEYRTYYEPEIHQPQVVREHYRDGVNNGLYRGREYDQGGQRQLENLHDARGQRQYGEAANHALRDFAKQAHQNQGAHENVHASGGQESHVQKAHDKGFYEREKKYGYEKAYGYERETKQHDKANNAASQGSGYNHNANRGHYNQGAEAVRDLAAHNNRHRQGSEAHANKNVLIDLSGEHNRGREIDSKYNNEQNLRDVNLVPSRHPIQIYQRPLFLRNGYNSVDNSLGRFRDMSGIHGLGGLRSYGSGYGYNPLRYGSNGLSDRDLVYLRPVVRYQVPVSDSYYIRPHA